MLMRPVGQTILAGREDGVPGNCLQAAFATLLELPLDAVPHFVLFESWVQALDMWLAGRGLKRTVLSPDEIGDRQCLLIGPSPRQVQHCIVADGNGGVWDPHPSRDGLVGITGAWVIETVS